VSCLLHDGTLARAGGFTAFGFQEGLRSEKLLVSLKPLKGFTLPTVN
jgi:hypothetical protein